MLCIVHPESPWTKDASRRRDPFASRRVRTFNRLHADERRRTHADARTRTQTLARGRRRTHADADVYILTCTHATHADARRRTQTHADARRRTQTNARPVWGRTQPQDASGRKTFVQGLSGCTISPKEIAESDITSWNLYDTYMHLLRIIG